MHLIRYSMDPFDCFTLLWIFPDGDGRYVLPHFFLFRFDFSTMVGFLQLVIGQYACFHRARCKFLIENAYSKSISCGILMKHEFFERCCVARCVLLLFVFFTFDLFDIANVRKLSNFPFLVVYDHLLLSTTSAVLYMYIGLSACSFACATIKQNYWFCFVLFVFLQTEIDIYDRQSSVAWWHFLVI